MMYKVHYDSIFMKEYSDFKSLFRQTKTLTFKLLPVGETEKNMVSDKIVECAKERMDTFEILKTVIDRNIKQALSDAIKTMVVDATDYSNLYFDNDTDKTRLWNEAAKLRSVISAKLKENPILKKADARSLVALWKETSKTEEELRAVETFEKSFTGMCGDYIARRLDLFDDQRKNGRVAFRAIDENLQVFLDNMLVLKDVLNHKITSFDELDSSFFEILDGRKVEDMFIPSLYGDFVSAEGIALYNTIIGGYAKEDGEKIQGINEKINLYKQANKGEKIPLMRQLKKRIMSDEITFSYVPTGYEDDKALMTALKDACNRLTEIIGSNGSLKRFLSHIDEYDVSRIFVDKAASTQLSGYAYGNWHVVEDGLTVRFDNENPKMVAIKDEKYVKSKDKYFKKHSSFSLSEIDTLASLAEKDESVLDFLRTLTPRGKTKSLYDIYDEASIKAYTILNSEYPAGSRELIKSKRHNNTIKEVLDSALEIIKCVRALASGLSLPDKDLMFAAELEVIVEKLDFFKQLYDKSRNYLSSNPWDGCKEIPLDFGYAKLLGGWALTKEKDNGGVILLKDGNYYLGILNKASRAFNLIDAPCDEDDRFEKVDIYYASDMNKTLPHVFFSNKSLSSGEFTPSDELLEAYRTHKEKRIPYTREQEVSLIGYYIDCCCNKKEWEMYDFTFRAPESYSSLDDFMEDAQRQALAMTKRPINASFINKAIKDNSLYLFQIYNRDFAEGKHQSGRDKTFTIILKSLFSDYNMSDIKYQIDGGASVFYREPAMALEDAVVHKAGIPIKLKQPKPDGPKEKTFAYDIIKKKHYTEPAYTIHIPITVNYKASKNTELNSRVNKFLIETGVKPNIVGIRRGKKNLVYMVVIDSDDRIIEQHSLNSPREGYNHDFAKMLDEKMLLREEERRNWQTVSEIKNLKAGYLSYVVNEVSNAMFKYSPCFLVIEDISNEQKNKLAIEKSLYYKFEEAIIRKLSYSFTKDSVPDGELGSAFNAVQLSCLPPKGTLSNFTGKQLGFVLFASGHSTDNVDPTTGFVSSRIFIDTRMSVASAKEFIQKFDCIELDANGLIRFDFDFQKLVRTVANVTGHTHWKAYSYGTRTVKVRDKDTGRSKYFEPDLTESFLKLFLEFGIDTERGNMIPQFLDIDEVSFWRGLLTKIMLLFRMRNEFGSEDDYLISSIMASDGRFFDSRRRDPFLPCCADANGAYHLALKGRLMLEKIAKCNIEDSKKPDLYISNEEWFDFVGR